MTTRTIVSKAISRISETVKNRPCSVEYGELIIPLGNITKMSPEYYEQLLNNQSNFHLYNIFHLIYSINPPKPDSENHNMSTMTIRCLEYYLDLDNSTRVDFIHEDMESIIKKINNLESSICDISHNPIKNASSKSTNKLLEASPSHSILTEKDILDEIQTVSSKIEELQDNHLQMLSSQNNKQFTDTVFQIFLFCILLVAYFFR